jgi:hypothetical protein
MHAQLEAIHKKALEVVSRYRACEADLIEVLQQADKARIYYALKYNSLYQYCTEGLGLSEDIAYNFIRLARKSVEIPALKEEIRAGSITVSKAKKIVPVLNKTNQTQWLDLAKTASKKDLERAVVTEKPELAVQEKVRFVQAERIHVQFGATPELARKLNRAREIESQKKGSVATLEVAVTAMADAYLRKEDPLQKASRFVDRNIADAWANLNGPILGKPLKAGEVKSLNAGAANDANLNLLVPGPVNVHSAAKNSAELVGAIGSPYKKPAPRLAPSSTSDQRRTYISSAIRHNLHLKFGGQCSHVDAGGKRCQQRRFLHIHHIKPVSHGGDDSLENLQLLCSGHHKAHHH